MNQFFSDLLSNSENVSSKRIISLTSFVIFCTLIYINLFTAKMINVDLLNALVMICISSSGLSVLESFSQSFNKKK
jgi:hypothetical protein